MMINSGSDAKVSLYYLVNNLFQLVYLLHLIF